MTERHVMGRLVRYPPPPVAPLGTTAALGVVESAGTASVSTGAAVYTKLGRGPTVKATVSALGKVLVILTGELSGSNNNSTAFMSVSVDDGVALDTHSLRVTGSNPVRGSIITLMTGLTPGEHTFVAVCKLSGNGVATFNARSITVIPM